MNSPLTKQWHNPENVPADKIPDGWRFMVPEEVDGRHKGKCRVWANHSEEFRGTERQYDCSGDEKRWTYIVPSSIPIPGAAPSTLPPKDCPVCGAENKHPILYEKRQGMTNQFYKCGSQQTNERFTQRCERPFLPWSGGECPVPEGTRVDVKFQNGTTATNVQALVMESYDEKTRMSAHDWTYRGPTGIVAWRLSDAAVPAPLPQPAEGEWVEWKGGECPLAVGTIADLKYGDGYVDFAAEVEGTPEAWLERGDDGIIAYRVLTPPTPTDPLAEVKAAHEAGKPIQWRSVEKGFPEWETTKDPVWDKNCEYRVEPAPVPVDPVDPYAELKAAHAEGKVIQFRWKESPHHPWGDIDAPRWNTKVDYRIKPEPVAVAELPWRPLEPDEKAVAGEDEFSDTAGINWYKVGLTAGRTPKGYPGIRFRTRRPKPVVEPTKIATEIGLERHPSCRRPYDISPELDTAEQISALVAIEPKTTNQTKHKTMETTQAKSNRIPEVGSKWRYVARSGKRKVARIVAADNRSIDTGKDLFDLDYWDVMTKIQLAPAKPLKGWRNPAEVARIQEQRLYGVPYHPVRRFIIRLIKSTLKVGGLVSLGVLFHAPIKWAILSGVSTALYWLAKLTGSQ